VHSLERRKNVIIINQGISHHANSSLSMYTCSYKGNLPPEHEIRHQFTVREVGKGGKIVIFIYQVITHHTNSILNMHKPAYFYKGNLPPEYEIRHRFSWQTKLLYTPSVYFSLHNSWGKQASLISTYSWQFLPAF